MSTEVDDETILDVLRTDGESRRTTTEVADELPVTRGTTRSRLQQLADDGRVRREKSGNHVVWWLPDADESDREGDAEGESGEVEHEVDEEEDEAGEGEDEAGEGDEETEEGDEEAEEEDEETGEGDEETETGTGGGDGEDTDVPVEAVSRDGTAVETSEGSEERRPTADGPTLGRDEEGLRAVALVAAGLVVLLLLRRLLRDETP